MHDQRPVRPDLVRGPLPPPGPLGVPGLRRDARTSGVHEPDPHGPAIGPVGAPAVGAAGPAAGVGAPPDVPRGAVPPAPIHVHHVPQRRSDASVHIMHLVLTVMTFGLWLPVWVVHAIVMAARDPAPPVPVAAPVPPPVMMRPPGPPVPPPTAEQINHAAIQQANARAHLRREARALAAQNPLMARELRIGRTDFPPYRRPYDDGGLIDVNLVPAGELTRFGIAPETAERIVRIREDVGGFSSAEELATIADLPPKLLPELIEYGLYLA
ncbi:ComEA family DNA-binding protein [Actinomadura atramentaria]|uniref:ComEA family DNA-binding protein n=1 Tax=Actinomadura atramentaria TaxID=1990 RepID=UPI0003A777A6|nr:helix-hairpin-helix domain-containing protein [Actinomadura atramentaria]